jgi:hypothetical protein
MTLLYIGLVLFVMGCVSLYLIVRRKFRRETEMINEHGAHVAMSTFERRVRISSAAALVFGGLVLVSLSYAMR